jgi:hypothetical protein
MGGYTGGSIYNNVIHKMTIPGEATSTPSTTLDQNVLDCAAGSSSAKGYRFAGGLGSSPFYSADIDGVLFADDSHVAVSASLNVGRLAVHGSGALKTKCFISGGAIGSGVGTSYRERFTFADESVAYASCSLPSDRWQLARVQNQSISCEVAAILESTLNIATEITAFDMASETNIVVGITYPATINNIASGGMSVGVIQ